MVNYDSRPVYWIWIVGDEEPKTDKDCLVIKDKATNSKGENNERRNRITNQ